MLQRAQQKAADEDPDDIEKLKARPNTHLLHTSTSDEDEESLSLLLLLLYLSRGKVGN